MNDQSLSLVPSLSKRHNFKPTKHNAPHLPQQLVKDLLEQPAAKDFASWVFTDFMKQVRVDIVNIHADSPLSPDTTMDASAIAATSTKIPSTGKSGRTLLHHAVAMSDHLLALEMIRLGASVDKRDATGHTPLSLALDLWILSLNMPGNLPAVYFAHREALIARLRLIIDTLLQQAADPNLVVQDKTCLHRACVIGDWSLISSLLQYGAFPVPPREGENACHAAPPASSLPQHSRSRFRRLAQQFLSEEMLPPRLCPCLSGKPLVECHARYGDTPYPPHFRCICGSKRSYETCSCSKRNYIVVEQYSSKTKRIQARVQTDVPFDPWVLSKGQAIDQEGIDIFAGSEEIDVLLDVERANHPDSEARHQKGLKKVRAMAAKLRDEGKVEPAFVYALERTDWCPRPQGRKGDKRGLKARQTEWNALVDEYIALGIDKRPAVVIERGAKIGLSLGALHVRCEHEGCGKMQGREVDTMRVCSGCKMSVFCSRECQVKAWPQHKTLCGGPVLREQMLDSQLEMLHAGRAIVGDSYAKNLLPHLNTEDREAAALIEGMVERFRQGKELTPEMREMANKARASLMLWRNNRITHEDLKKLKMNPETKA